MMKVRTVKKSSINNLNLFLIGLFCQINPLMPKKAMIIYIGICLCLFLISHENVNKIKFNTSLKWYGLFFLFVIFSSLYTVNTINTDYVFVRMTSYFILAFMATQRLNNQDNFIHLLKGFVFGGILGIIKVLIVQYEYIGVKRIGYSLKGNLFGSYAEFGNVCMYSACAMIGLALMDKKVKNKINKFFFVIISLLIILAIFLSGARKAIIMPIVLLIFVKILDSNKKMGKRLYSLLLIVLILLGGIYISLSNKYLYNSIGYRIESGISEVFESQDTDASLNERSSFVNFARKMFCKKPILGWGVHSFAYLNYQAGGQLVYCHNNFLEILSCYGIIGFALYYNLFLKIILNYKKLRKDKIGLYLYSLTLIIVFLEPYSISFLSPFIVIIMCCCGDYLKEVGCYDVEDYKKNYKSIT